MNSNWIKHAKTTEEKKKIKETLQNSKYVLDLLSSILTKELKEYDSTSSEDYNIPNWSYYQADRNGYRRAIKSFLNLINFKE